MGEFIKEIEKVSPHVSKDFLENKNFSTDAKHTTMIVDTASPSTIIGKDTFTKLGTTYPAAISRAFEYQE